MPKVTNAELLRLEENLVKMKKLGAEYDALDRDAKAIIAKAQEDLQSTDKATAKRGEFILSWAEKNGSVAWKSEFVKVAGAAAAKKLTADAPKKKSVVITRTAKTAASA